MDYKGKSQLKFKILNIVAFVVAMVLNSTAQRFSPYTLNEISTTRSTSIGVAGYALGIWVLIYFLIAVFIVYQALPSSSVEKRNDKLIYEDIGYLFAINMVCNGMWLVSFMQNTVLAFAIAFLFMAGIEVTCLMIYYKANRAKLNTIEFFCIRICFSLYSGWVTGATIVSFATFLQALGMDQNQQTWAIIILSVAVFIYNLACFMEREPLFGVIYIWVIFAVRKEQDELYRQDIVDAIPIIVSVHIVIWLAITIFTVYQKMKGKCERGLLF